MLETRCHCGAVAIAVARRPDSVTNCSCAICRRYGTLWAYFDPSDVRVTSEPGALEAYAWGHGTLRFMRCTTCGCVTHWEPLAGRASTRMAVNARNFTPAQLGDVPIRLLDGAVTERYLTP